MKELATLALVILPLGMTIVECLAADGSTAAPEPHNGGGDGQPDADREAAPAPAPDTTGSRTRIAELRRYPW